MDNLARHSGGKRLRARRAGLVLGAPLLALVLAGCSQEAQDQWKNLSLPEGVTQESHLVEQLWRGSWITALVVGVVVWGLIALCCILFRRRRHERGFPPQVRYNVPIEVLYTALPFIIITVLFFFTARDETKLLQLSSQPPVHQVNVVGFRWGWDFNYKPVPGSPVPAAGVYEHGIPAEPSTLVLPRGEKVRFILEARDVIHSFWVPAFLFKLDVIPGRENVFEVTPEKLGTYAGKCAELCGLDHARMLFNVQVVEPAEYRAYLERLAAEGQVGELPAENGPVEVEESEPEAESRL
ncbi:MAG: cytochrome c oxidase subunit II [Actinomycetota bacterium]|nr:cytochrome c oxidase subunit II [Actinomycetota bacterium]